MFFIRYLYLILLQLSLSLYLCADDFSDDFSDDYSSGYDSKATDLKVKEKNYKLKGNIKLSSAYSYAHKDPLANETDWQGFSKNKTEINFELEVDLNKSLRFFTSAIGYYDLIYKSGNKNYTDEVIDEYKQDLELKKLYLRKKISSNIDIKIGRQIIVWGKSDNIRITDILNPLDMREPGLTDIKNLRIPLFMSRVDYYLNNWNISLILNHEKRYNKTPAIGSDFYNYPFEISEKTSKEIEFQSPETALALNGVFPGFDISFYLANIYEDTPNIQNKNSSQADLFKLNHENIFIFGTALNKAYNNYLFKLEAAFLDGLRYSFSPEDYKRIDYLFGVEYQGFRNASLSFEFANRYIQNFSENEAPSFLKENNYQYALRYSKQLLNDRLEVSILAILLGKKADNGGFYRLMADYDLNDYITLESGLIAYDAQDTDRLFINISYSF